MESVFTRVDFSFLLIPLDLSGPFLSAPMGMDRQASVDDLPQAKVFLHAFLLFFQVNDLSSCPFFGVYNEAG